MAERKGSVWLGGTAAWRTGDTKLSLELLADVSGNSKGRQLKLGAEHRFRFGQLQLTPYVAAILRDRKYVDYYFGVRPEEAMPGRPAYAGRRTTDAELGLRVDYALTSRQALGLDLSSESFGSSVEASPIVDRS